MWRAKSHYPISFSIIEARMKTLTISSLEPFRTLFTISSSPKKSGIPSLNSTSLQLESLSFSVILRRESHSTPRYAFCATKRSPNLAVAKCVSSISSSAPANNLVWNDTLPLEEGGTIDSEVVASEDEEEDAVAGVKLAIPVRAFFFSTRFGFFFIFSSVYLFCFPVMNFVLGIIEITL